MVPIDYALGDIFRDGEEVVVIVRGEDGQLLQVQVPVRRERVQSQEGGTVMIHG